MNGFADRVLDTSTSTGAGDFTLSGTPPTGFRAWNAAGAFAVGDRVWYEIEAVDGSGNPTGEWESGYGTLAGATTLARTEPKQSSSGTLPLSFSAGTKNVFCTLTDAFLERVSTVGMLLARDLIMP